MRQQTTVFAILMGLLIYLPARGQFIIPDAKAEGDIIRPDGGIIRLSTANSSLNLSYVRYQSASAWFNGATATGKLTNGVRAFFDGGKVPIGGDIGAYLGYFFTETSELDSLLPTTHGIPDSAAKTEQVWLTASGTIGSQEVIVFSREAALNQQLRDEAITRWSFNLHGNAFFGGPAIVVSFAVGRQRLDNVEDLDVVTVKTARSFKSVDTVAKITLTADESESHTAREGAVTQWHETSMRANAAHVVAGVPLVAVGQVKYRIPDGVDTSKVRTSAGLDLGAGLFFLTSSDSDPSDQLGGIYLEFPDVFDQAESGESLWRRTRITFQLSYPFAF